MTVAVAPATTAALADYLRVNHWTVARWANRWHGPVGSGNYRTLDAVDVAVGVAWWHIGHGATAGGLFTHQLHHLRDLAEHAIRRDPRRWLFLAATEALTFDTAADAALWWWTHGPDAVQIIDLEARP